MLNYEYDVEAEKRVLEKLLKEGVPFDIALKQAESGIIDRQPVF